MTKNKKAEEIAFSRCDVPERTKRFALQYVSEAYAGIKNCRECEFYNTCIRIDSVRAELRKKKKEGMKNMTEQETREKIFNIIREFNVKKRRYSTHTEPNDDDELADALIAAGIGDVKDLQVQVDSLEITNIALQAGYDDAEKDRLYWVDKYKEAEHRAEVAEHELERRLAEATKAMYVYERALYYATLNGETADEVKYNDALKRAQKDFAENKGD